LATTEKPRTNGHATIAEEVPVAQGIRYPGMPGHIERIIKAAADGINKNELAAELQKTFTTIDPDKPASAISYHLNNMVKAKRINVVNGIIRWGKGESATKRPYNKRDANGDPVKHISDSLSVDSRIILMQLDRAVMELNVARDMIAKVLK
jgi:hypothetical protein